MKLISMDSDQYLIEISGVGVGFCKDMSLKNSSPGFVFSKMSLTLVMLDRIKRSKNQKCYVEK